MVGIDQEYSPAGNTIAFSDFNRGGVQAAIYLMGPHGTNVRELSPPSLQARDPDWSPGSVCARARPMAARGVASPGGMSGYSLSWSRGICRCRGLRSGANFTSRPHGTRSSLSALLRGLTVRVTLLRASVSRATAHDGLAIGVTSLYQ